MKGSPMFASAASSYCTVLASALLLSGCGVIFTHPAEVCNTDPYELRWDEEIPGSQTPEEILAIAEGEYTLVGGSSLHNEDQEFLLRVERLGETNVYHVLDPERSSANCTTAIHLPVTIGISTPDGLLDETFTVNLYRDLDESLGTGIYIDVDDINGSWVPEISPRHSSSPKVLVQMYFSQEEASGNISIPGPPGSTEWEQVWFW